MSFESFVGVALRASLLLALTFAGFFATRHASASVRRCLLLLGLGASLSVPMISLSLSGRALLHVAPPALAGRVFAESSSAAATPLTQPALRARAAVRAQTPFSPATWLVELWTVGASLVFARAALGHLRALRIAARAQNPGGGLRVSAEIESPMVIGLLQPIILVPLSAASWSAERLEAVLRHESAHVQRRDGLALLLAQCVCTLYWFQPLAWLALRALRRECELAADEDVIRAGMRASSYAEHLLAIAGGFRGPSAGIAMASRPSELGRRVQALLARERLPTRLTTRGALLLAVAAASTLSFVACTDAAPQRAKTPASASARLAALEPRLQQIALDEAQRVHAEWGAERVAIVVLNPLNGAVVAYADDAPGSPVVPASTLKPFTVALALDDDLIRPTQQFDCGHGTRAYGMQVFRDVGENGSLDVAEILAVSSNVGVSRIFDVLGGERLARGLRRFRVAAPENIPSGTLRGAIFANGEGSTTTPVALAAAYGVFANDGVLAAAEPQRVLKPSTARSMRQMLEGVVASERGTGKAAALPGVRVGGKTGTHDDEPECESCAHSPGIGIFASFVGIVPIDRPRWVIYVGVGGPKREGSGGTIAAPVFARIAARAISL